MYNNSFYFFNNFFLNYRLDLILCKFFFNFSRNDIKQFIFNNIFIFKLFFIKFVNFEFKLINKFLLKFLIFIQIYYENNYFLIINKPFNVVICNSKNVLNNSLFNNLLYFYGKRVFKTFRSGFLNRVDKNTSGIFIVFKKNSFYIDYLNQFSKNIINKSYLIFIFGFFDFSLNYIKSFSSLRNVSDFFSLKKSLTFFYCFKKVKFFDFFVSFVKCNIFSGRTHQLRIHFNYIKKYIICDNIYNNFDNYIFINYIDRHCIHLFSINFFFLKSNLFFLNSVFKDMLFLKNIFNFF